MIVMYEFEAVRNDKDNQTNEYEVVQHISSKVRQAREGKGPIIYCSCYKRWVSTREVTIPIQTSPIISNIVVQLMHWRNRLNYCIHFNLSSPSFNR